MNVKSSGGHGDSALIVASKSGHLEMVRALLNGNGVNVTIRNTKSESRSCIVGCQRSECKHSE